MKITIVGTGYVGLVTGVCLADLGNDVFCLDVDEAKVAMLNGGEMPLYEPGLEQLLQYNLEAGRIRFSIDLKAAIAHAEVQFIAVGTPAGEDGSADLQHVIEAARSIGRAMSGFKVVVNKSTVPVGTADRVADVIRHELTKRGVGNQDFAVVSNPEFLKEGAAVEDFMRPDRIVVGVSDDENGRRALAKMRDIYAPFNRNHERMRVMDRRSAEFTKYAANAMLATRISFMNELANLADEVGADIELVRQGIGSDPRIGYGFLYAGSGYGGSCLPKDVKALIKTATGYGRRLRILESVEAVNNRQKNILSEKVFAHFGADLSGKKFAVWGLSFKPNTDDMREAPSRAVIVALLRAGASIVAHDPIAQQQATKALMSDLTETEFAKSRLSFTDSHLKALTDVDALIIMTEWKAYRSPNILAMKSTMKNAVVFDGRNLYEPEAMRVAGICYFGIGRNG